MENSVIQSEASLIQLIHEIWDSLILPVMIRRLKSIWSSAEVVETRGIQVGCTEMPSRAYLLKIDKSYPSLKIQSQHQMRNPPTNCLQPTVSKCAYFS